MTARPKPRESGFALLLVFLMAAAIAITLYIEIPRVAFESQRQKELLLIERGEQYKRAIQLFVKKNSRYPARIEELESLNNVRYLRHRYKDPITGKDEWRLIHVGPGGVFTDSLVNKPPTQDKDKQEPNRNTFIAEGPAIGSTQAQGQQAVNPALRRRVSEGGTPGGTVIGPDGLPVQPQPGMAGIAPMPGMTGQPGQVPTAGALPGQNFPGQTGDPNAPQNPAQPAIAGQNPAVQPGQPGVPYPGQPGVTYPGQPGVTYPGQPGVTYPGQPGVTYPGQPGVTYPGQQGSTYPGQPGSVYPGQPGTTYPGAAQSGGLGNTPYIGSSTPYIGGSATPASGMPGQPMGGRYPGMPGMPVSSQTGGVSPYPIQAGSQGNSPPFPQPGLQTGQNNAAVQMIQQILTSPRANMPTTNAGMLGLNIGPGIAGVASTSEDEGILVYNDKTKYNEWEFIYDPTKEKRPANPNAGGIGTPASQMGSTAGSPNPNSPNSPPSPYGTNPGFSGFGNSGFGNSGFGQTQPTTGFGQTSQPNTGFGQTSQPNTGFGRP